MDDETSSLQTRQTLAELSRQVTQLQHALSQQRDVNASLTADNERLLQTREQDRQRHVNVGRCFNSLSALNQVLNVDRVRHFGSDVAALVKPQTPSFKKQSALIFAA